jgi:hypothetical protein
LTSRTLILSAAVTLLGTAPVFAQQSSSSPPQSQSGQSEQSGGQQVIQQQDLQKYVQALQQMAQFEPGISQALQQGRPIDPMVLNKVPSQAARKAIEQSGLGMEEFRYITEQLTTNPSAEQQFKQAAQQAAQQSGGGQPGSSGSGQSSSGTQPSSSPL